MARLEPTGVAGAPVVESVFRVEGMCCGQEASLLRQRLGGLSGVTAVETDVVGQKIRVTHDPHATETSAIAHVVAEAGMRAWMADEPHDSAPAAPDETRRGWLLGVSGLCLAIGGGLCLVDGGVLAAGPALRAWEIGLLATSILAGGIAPARRALTSLGARSLDMNVLMVIAVIGAVALGDWVEAATVVFLFSVSQWLESQSMARARRAIGSLVSLAPPEAVVRRPEGDLRLPLDDVAVGDVMIVRPGERFALDGIVESGESEVNQAPVTGESVPVEKSPGDTVFAGSVNGHALVTVKVTRLRRDSTLARIVHLVERAQAERAPIQSFVDRFARVYTPAVIVLAAVVAVVPPLVLGQPFSDWLYRALVLLVIACPCALVISTPVTIVSAIAAAARQGVLFKGGVYLERLGLVRAVAFDKTGTLTSGNLRVREVVALEGRDSSTILATAAAIGVRSEHPVARAIAHHAGATGLAATPADSYRTLPGRGAEADVAGQPALIGNHRLFEERRLCSEPLHPHLDALADRGRTAVMVAHDGRTIGIVGVSDEVRTTGRAAVSALRAAGVKRIVMLTGDRAAAAAAIAAEVGVDEVRAELLPEDKVKAVAELRRTAGVVAMIGDGVNDAPALAAADVGIAMGAAGSDAALETADVALMSGDLTRVPYAVRLGRAALATVKVNIAIAIGLKAIFLGLALFGVATLWMAVLADTGASLVVVANGLRVLRTR